MKKLVFVLNDLPAVGKSTLSEVISGQLSRKSVTTSLVATVCSNDADDRLSQSETIIPWDFEDDEDLSKLVSFLDENEVVVVDVGTGDTADLHDFSERSQLFEFLGELGVELTLVIPVNSNPDHEDAVVEIAEAFADNADYVIVWEAEADKNGWDDSYASKVMSYLSAVEITAPAINGAFARSLDSHDYELHDAIANRDELPGDLKSALKKWESQFGKLIESEAGEFVFPEQEETRVPGHGDQSSAAVAV